jgi:hypothetical protein
LPKARKRVVQRSERRETKRRQVRMRKAAQQSKGGFFGWLKRLFRRRKR